MNDSVLTDVLEGRVSRRDLLRWGAAGGIGLAGLTLNIDSVAEVFASEAAKGSLAGLITAAKKEGHINVITLPRDWANYGVIMDKFQSKYGLGLTDANPDGSSADELAAIRQLKGQSRAPDVVDVGPPFAEQGRKAGLFVPYKVSTWSSIPSNMKNPHGVWYGDYWGAMSFLTMTNVVKNPPKDWSDLLKPEYKGMVGIDGDPRQAGDAFGAVMAASLGNGGSPDDITPGIDFFAKLKQVGNFNPGRALPGEILKGSIPIAIRWDYLNLSTRDEAVKAGQKAVVNIPTHPYGGYYCQAISASAPHPNAAKLWMEFLYSDVGQLLFLAGYTHPARYNYLVKHGKVTKALAAKLPPAASYKGIKFANVNQINKAAAVLQAQWGPKVGGS